MAAIDEDMHLADAVAPAPRDMPDSQTPSNIHAQKGIALEKVLELRSKGLTYEQIGKVLGVTKPTIWWHLRNHKDDIDALDAFKGSRADILALTQRKLINSLTPEDIEKASAYQRVGMFGILYDKERLERGQSTSNVAYHDVSGSLKSHLDEVRQLADELGVDVDLSEDTDS